MGKPTDQQPVLKRRAACRTERTVGEMKTCMHNQMHQYVCDSKCMHDFYNPPKQARAQLPAGVAVQDGVWEALQRMIESTAVLGPASREDALCVAKYRDRVRFLAAPHPVSVDQSPTCEIAQVIEFANLIVSDVNDLIAIIKRHLAPHPVLRRVEQSE